MRPEQRHLIPEVAMGLGWTVLRLRRGPDLQIGFVVGRSGRPFRVSAAIGVPGLRHARPIADQLALDPQVGIRGPVFAFTTPLPQANAYAMVRRRAQAAGIATRIG